MDMRKNFLQAALAASVVAAGLWASHAHANSTSGADEVRAMDRDGNGTVSATEHEAGAKAMFAKMDANSDGTVTATEMDAAKAEAGKDDGMGKSSAEKIATIDTNQDGELSAAEHAAGSTMMFGKMDVNHDGALTAAEIQAGHDKMLRKSS
jgi:hypothetical protein